MRSAKSAILGCLLGGVAVSGWAAEVASSALAATPVKVASNGWHGGAWLGAGYWGGDITYKMGGEYKHSSQGTTWDPAIEVTWPINVALASVGGNFGYRDCFDVDIAVAANIDDPSGKIELYAKADPLNTSQVTTRQEGDAELEAYRGDFDLKVWLFHVGPKEKACFMVGPIGGFLFQHLDWTGKNGDEWYPPHPEIPHKRTPGEVATYKLDTQAPYVGLATKVLMGRLVFDADVALGYYWFSDKGSDSVTHEFVETDDSDWGWKADAQVRFYFAKHFYAQALVNALVYEINAVQKQHYLDGYSEADRKTESTQITGLLALGCEF